MDATVFKKNAHKKLKKPPLKVAQKYSPWAAKTAQKEEFMFQNVAYRPTVLKTGVSVLLSSSLLESLFTAVNSRAYVPRFFKGLRWKFTLYTVKFLKLHICDEELHTDQFDRIFTHSKFRKFS